MSHSNNFLTLVTSALRLTLWLMALQIVVAKKNDALPLSHLEKTIKDIPSCYKQVDENNVSVYFACMSNISQDLPYTFVANMLRNNYIHAFPTEEKRAKIDDFNEALIIDFQQMGLRASTAETEYLKNEIHRLENAKQYTRLRTVLLAYKNSGLTSLDKLIEQAAKKMVVYYNQQINVSSITADEKWKLLIHLIETHYLTNNYRHMLVMLNQAIDMVLQSPTMTILSPAGKMILRYQKIALENSLLLGYNLTPIDVDKDFKKWILSKAPVFEARMKEKFQIIDAGPKWKPSQSSTNFFRKETESKKTNHIKNRLSREL